MTDLAIATEKLTRRFGALTAVDNIDLCVSAGQFFGFLGPNGAGKSTTIKMLTGLLAPTSGRVQLLGLDFSSQSVEVKRQIGVVPEGMGLFERLTGAEYLNFVGRMYGLDRGTTLQRTRELLEFMQLADRPKSMIADYSHGMQKKLALAAAVIDGARRDNFSHFARAGNCRATVQPRRNHSPGTAGGAGLHRGIARGHRR